MLFLMARHAGSAAAPRARPNLRKKKTRPGNQTSSERAFVSARREAIQAVNKLHRGWDSDPARLAHLANDARHALAQLWSAASHLAGLTSILLLT